MMHSAYITYMSCRHFQTLFVSGRLWCLYGASSITRSIWDSIFRICACKQKNG